MNQFNQINQKNYYTQYSTKNENEKNFKNNLVLLAKHLKTQIGSNGNKFLYEKLNDISTRIQKRINQGTLTRNDINKYRYELNIAADIHLYNQKIEDFFKICTLLAKHTTNYKTKLNYFGFTNKTASIRALQAYELSSPVIADLKKERLQLHNKFSMFPSLKLLTNDLQNADLSRADFSWWADLKKTNMSGANLSRANLSGANLWGANLSKANLSGANLSKANLSMVNLRGANLSEVNLSGADLVLAHFDDKSQISLKFSSNLFIEFNHLNNSNSKSILTTINSIEDNYKVLKVNLMKQVFEYLKDKDITTIIEALRDGLFNVRFDYSKALNSVPAFKENFFAGIYVNGNTKTLQMTESELLIHINFLKELGNEDLKNFINNNQRFFGQLCNCLSGVRSRDKLVLVSEYNALYERYLKQYGKISYRQFKKIF